MGNVKAAEFVLRGVSSINCLFSDVEVGGIRFRCVNGVLVGRFEVVNENPEVMAKLLALALSLVSGCGFEACCVGVDSCMVVNVPISASVTVGLGQTPEQMTGTPIMHMPITIQVSVSKAIDLDKGMLDEAVKLMDKLWDALRDPSTNKRAEGLLRVVRWWVSGTLDEDPLDRFLKFFVAFELLVSLMGYKGKNKEKGKKGKNKGHEEESGSSWVEKFCSDHGLACEFEGMRVNEVRNLIMHEPGEDRDQAEEVARKHADEFGREVLKAIRRVMGEELKISI
jgi:hypothetical protein